MTLFTRLSSTFISRVDRAVAHIENHDAVVEAALRETHAALAKAKVRFARVQRDGENLRQKHAETQQMAIKWAERARAIAAQDEPKALECLQRRNQCSKQAEQSAQAITRHEELEQQMGASVLQMEERLNTLTQQRNIMRSRHSAADALRVINSIENHAGLGIEDTFDRWEMLITETEYASGNQLHAHSNPTDTLDASFQKTETQAILKAELAALLQTTLTVKE